MTTEQETAPATRVDVQWVGFIASSTTLVTSLLSRFVFRGEVPLEVAGIIQYVVPLGLTAAAAELRWRIARRRAR